MQSLLARHLSHHQQHQKELISFLVSLNLETILDFFISADSSSIQQVKDFWEYKLCFCGLTNSDIPLSKAPNFFPFPDEHPTFAPTSLTTTTTTNSTTNFQPCTSIRLSLHPCLSNAAFSLSFGHSCDS